MKEVKEPIENVYTQEYDPLQSSYSYEDSEEGARLIKALEKEIEEERNRNESSKSAEVIVGEVTSDKMRGRNDRNKSESWEQSRKEIIQAEIMKRNLSFILDKQYLKEMNDKDLMIF